MNPPFLVKSIAEEFIYFFSQATRHSVSFCSGKRGLGYIYFLILKSKIM